MHERERQPEIAYIAMGSNLEPREATLRAAVESMDVITGIRVLRVSALRETMPVGPVTDQPAFINGVAEVETTLLPHPLLAELLRIEASFGRDRSCEARWGPRTLDLDLLLMSDRVVNEPGLELPHPRLHVRRFVLEPLAELARDVVHPVSRMSMATLLERLESVSAGM